MINEKAIERGIKKLTMNALPYKDLNLERINEKLFMLPLRRISIKTVVYLFFVILNLILYITAFFTELSWLYVISFFFSVAIILSWFTIWSKNIVKALFKSRKIGPKI